MPLSEHEQRLLEQMERALYAEDPKFATTLRSGGSGRANRGRAALGVVAFLAGIAVLMGGVVTNLIPVGVVGFLVMLVGAVLTYAALRSGPAATPAEAEAAPGATGTTAGPAAPSSAKKARSGGLMDRLEDRWRRRRDQGGL